MVKGFVQYLAEASQWSLRQFTHLVASTQRTASDQRRAGEQVRQSYLPLLVKYFTEYATGEVPNTVYTEIKRVASFVVEHGTAEPEDIWEMARTTASPTLYASRSTLSVAYPHEVPAKLKRAEAAARRATHPDDKTYYAWLLPVLRELLPVAQMMDELKSRVVKRQPKAPVDVQTAYHAPMVSTDAGRVVREVLQQLTDKLKDDYASYVAQYFMEHAKAFAALAPQVQRAVHTRYQDVLSVREAWVLPRMNEPFTLAPGAAQKFQHAAARAAATMQQQFLEKNIKKLAHILTTKNVALKQPPTILHLSASRGVFEGDIRVVFADGAQFTVRNKIVWKQSTNGIAFNQFPTTFHDVKLPGGVAMPQPSEERMNTVFAVS